MTTAKPKIGISRCLLGDAVRYDGASKPCDTIDELQQLFELIPICPEVEAGLGVPRPPVQLSGDIEQPRMLGRDDASLDVTPAIHAFCEQRIPELSALEAYICKSRSPSCGLGTTPIFIDDECVTENSDGIFIRTLTLYHPHILIIDELALQSTIARTQFIDKIFINR